MPTTGEKPGTGTYTCTTCGQMVVLDDDSIQCRLVPSVVEQILINQA